MSSALEGGVSEWLLVAVGGALGGLTNAYLSNERRFFLPGFSRDDHMRIRFDPGLLGNVAVGALTGLIVWGLYSPDPSLKTLSTNIKPAIAAFVAGLGGGRTLTALMHPRGGGPRPPSGLRHVAPRSSRSTVTRGLRLRRAE